MFNEYQKISSKHFREHTELSAEQSRILNWVLGLNGESGEVTELIKHHIFGGEPLDKMELAKELGDILWYIAAICTTTEMDLSVIAELNAHKLHHRYGSAYDEEGLSQRREKEIAFKDTFIYKSLKAKIYHTAAPLNVIFVGPDGSGKTSVTKVVQERLASEGFIYHKCNNEQEDKPELALRLLEEQTNVIYDRFYYPDDILYTKVVQERHSDEPIDWSTDYWKKYNEVRDALCNLNTVFIYLTAEDEELQKRSASWKDDYVFKEELPKIKELYRRWLNQIVPLPVIVFTFDTTGRTADDVAMECTAAIHRAQAAFVGMNSSTFVTEEELEYERIRKEFEAQAEAEAEEELRKELPDNVTEFPKS